VSVLAPLIVGLALTACSRQPPAQEQPAAAAKSSPPETTAAPPPAPPDIRLPDAAGDWTASGPVSVYDTETIYSYIDGHAEVYRAYGFKRCISRRFTGPTGESAIVADIFELASPEDAFGMFTHDRDGEPAGVGNDSLLRYGWLSFWKGPYFVSIVAEGDTERSRAAVLELGRAAAAALPAEGQPPPIVRDLPARDLDPRSVRFLRHAQILNTHVFVSDENVFGLAPDTGAALGSYKRGSARAHVLLVDYPDAERASAAGNSARKGLLNGATGDTPVAAKDGTLVALRVTGRRLVVVIGATSAGFARDLLNLASPSK
jgi:hypothetical protein